MTERQLIRRDLVDEIYASAADVPCDRKAIMAGGLSGAGKSTVLDRHADVERSQYLTVNPDDIKEAMAGRGLIPELDGLSPVVSGRWRRASHPLTGGHDSEVGRSAPPIAPVSAGPV